jgi:hypothetical protein
MLAYMRKKKERVSGPVRKMPVYQGPQPPPNRFGKKCLLLLSVSVESRLVLWIKMLESI